MTELQAIFDEVQAAGVRLEVEGGKLMADPAGRLPEPLKDRIRAVKPEIIRVLCRETEDLTVSMNRLEAAAVSVAVWPDGTMRIVATWDTWPEGATVWTPGEMRMYVSLSGSERRLMRGLKTIRQGGKREV